MKGLVNLKNFDVKRRISAGAFGEVFLVIEKNTGRMCAAKVSLKKIEDNSINETRNLRRKIDIISRLNHPTVLKFIGFSYTNFLNERKPTIITEFMSNDTLEKMIDLERRGSALNDWDDTRKLIIIYSIASAMKYLHIHGIIHRDLKPANIFMDEYLIPRVGDFGLSKIILSSFCGSHSEKDVKGTTLYMAPEIHTNCEYTKAIDVYAFAIIVYEIITNQAPFPNCGSYQISCKVVNGERPEFKYKIPDSYKRLIEKCWSHDPKVRPTFDEIVNDLEKDPGFITETVDEDDYRFFIEYINEYKTTFIERNELITFEEFNQSRNRSVKIVDVKARSVKSNTRMLNLSSKPNHENEEIYSKNELIMQKHKKKKTMKRYGVHVLKTDELFKPKLDLQRTKSPINREISNKKTSCIGTIIKYFEAAAFGGHPEAAYRLGEIYSKGDRVPVDKPKALGCFLMGAENKHITSTFMAAYMLYIGEGVPVDKKQAAILFKKAADLGDGKSMAFYAYMLKTGDCVTMDKEKSDEYFKKAFDADNNLLPFVTLGCALINGNFNENEKNEGVKFIIFAAENGSPYGSFEYAKLLYHGNRVTQDKEKAAHYYKFAADHNIHDAIKAYIDIAEKGDGIPVNEEEAVEYMVKMGNLLYGIERQSPDN